MEGAGIRKGSRLGPRRNVNAGLHDDVPLLLKPLDLGAVPADLTTTRNTHVLLHVLGDGGALSGKQGPSVVHLLVNKPSVLRRRQRLRPVAAVRFVPLAAKSWLVALHGVGKVPSLSTVEGIHVKVLRTRWGGEWKRG